MVKLFLHHAIVHKNNIEQSKSWRKYSMHIFVVVVAVAATDVTTTDAIHK